MNPQPGPEYEVTLHVDPAVAAEFDEWLAAHVAAMLELPGFSGATVLDSDDVEAARVVRVVRYRLESAEALERYLAGPAARMRQLAVERFGDRVSATRRVLAAHDSGRRQQCLNCASELVGQYCSNCGQRARSRLISIWELIRDAFGDLFELDSRLWQTIIPLLFRPGRLTRDYLLGRRARYMPPFRTYLVLSVVFFLVAFFDPRQQFALFLEPAAEQTETTKSRSEAQEEAIEELAREGIRVGSDEEGNPLVDCSIDGESLQQLPGWLGRRLTPERLESVCENVTADSGRAFFGQLLDNVPAGLFILLPLMALVLKFLYPLTGRYYAEHLLFILHFHAFFFLILTLHILFSRLSVQLHMPNAVVGIASFAVSLYIPVYLYKGLRRVYEQGRLATLFKFLLLVAAYVLGFALLLFVVAFYTAFSI